jgi:hypothetical protein
MSKYIQRYNIKGEEISICVCQTCGNKVNTAVFEQIINSGAIIKSDLVFVSQITKENRLNELKVIDMISNCCKMPYYLYLHLDENGEMTFGA